jgi:2-haloacid dehalogenase
MIEAISFDCYGTLIDWERGILAAVKPLLSSKGVELEDGEILRLYADLEAKAEGGDFLPYREILRTVAQGFGERFGFTPSRKEQNCIAESIREWEPFPDTVKALCELKKKFRLAVISNTDEDLIAVTLRKLGVDFDWVITAERARSYKPSLNNFRLALKIMDLPPGRVLHAAQSVYHDIIPAKSLGMATALVLRRGHGATPLAKAEPDIMVKDLTELAQKLTT